MRPIFADPKTDFVFKRIFGSEQHKPLLIALLNDLLELADEHLIADVTFLDSAQRPAVSQLKYSIVDVKCRDRRGVTYVVEMQVLNVEGFEKRVVYNVAKAYTSQLGAGEGYPALDDVIGVSICDFELWPGTEVPMLSRWCMQEQHQGARGLPQMQFVFLELPKYTAADQPESVIDRWAYFFRAAPSLTVVPTALSQAPMDQALEAARSAGFSEDEWDAYIRAGMALQDERGALSKARTEGLQQGIQQGIQQGLRKGLINGIVTACELLDIALDEAMRAALDDCDIGQLEAVLRHVREQRSWPPAVPPAP